jgi:hypothetical protein
VALCGTVAEAGVVDGFVLGSHAEYCEGCGLSQIEEFFLASRKVYVRRSDESKDY